jgi:hypothetical protein
MKMHRLVHDIGIGKIGLTPDEDAKFSKIVFDLDAVMRLNSQQSAENGELAAGLMKSP